MKKAFVLALAGVALMTAGCGKLAEAPAAEGYDVVIPRVANTRIQGLDEIVEAALAERTAPGAVLMVGTASEMLHVAAYGKQTYDDDAQPVRLDTVWDLASLSKVVGTASASFIAMSDGKLDPAAPVDRYVPGFGTNGKEGVTVADLMTHSSGLKAYETWSKVEATRTGDESHADALLRTYAALPASYPPRTKHVYSCLNFQTLARVNETVTGLTQDELLRTRLYGPLGMKDTTWNPNAEQLLRTVPAQKGIVPGTIHDPLARYHETSDQHCPGNAGLFGTGPDLARYATMILRRGKAPNGDQLISAAVLEESFKNHLSTTIEEKRGLGWDIWESEAYTTPLNTEPGRQIIGHTGYTGTLIWIDLYSGTYVVLLTNRTWPDDSKESSAAITRLRKAVVQHVLRSRPEYAEHFAKAE